jgi:uncharacterized protein
VKLKKVLLLVLAAVAVFYVGFLVVLFLGQRALIYPGVRNRVSPFVPQAAGIEPLRVASAQGTVDALFLPAPTVPGKRQPVVMFAHGNGEVIDLWTSQLHGFQERGIGVLLVEYPGYGRSTGTPSQDSIRLALDAAYDRIVADPRVDAGRVFGFGQSLGGGAICQLARDRPLRALILQSTFTSLDVFAAGYGAPSFLLRDHFDNLAVVRSFAGPVLVIHGEQDGVIPWRLGRELAAASSHATFRLYQCGHVCWDPGRVPFWRDAVPFLISAGILREVPDVSAGAPLRAVTKG